MTLFSNIAFFAAAQGIFLSVVLFFLPRGNRKANTFLAAFILCFSLWIAEFAAWFTDDLYQFPHLLFTTTGLPLLLGPFLLFYTKALRQENPLSNQWNWLHFLPFLLHLFYLSPFLMATTAHKLETLRELQNTNNPPEFSIVFYIQESLKFIQLVSYIYLVSRLYSNWKVDPKNSLKKYQLNWLKILLIGATLFAFFDLTHFLGLYLFQYDYLFILARTTLLIGVLMSYFIGYVTLRQPEIFAGELTKKKNGNRYEKSAFNSSKADSYQQELLQKMETAKLYLNSDLKQKDLAEEVGLSTHHFSQLLNEHLQKNYFDFVNEYRVKAAQAMLMDPDFSHFTILSIAYDAGFKNKASFNTAFKKHTGLTPSQYKKQFLALKK